MNTKITILILILLGVSITSFAQQGSDHFYYYKGDKIYLEPHTLYASITMEGNDSDVKRTLEDKNYTLSVPVKDNTQNRLDSKGKYSTNKAKNLDIYRGEIEFPEILSIQEYWQKLDEIKNIPGVKTVSPCFKDSEGEKIGLSNYCYVKLNNGKDLELLKEEAEKHNLDIVGKNKFMPLWFTLDCTSNSSLNSMQLANLMHETGIFAVVEPSLMLDNVIQDCANDPYAASQWGLSNTGQHGGDSQYDINACEAWDLSKGAGVTVAIFDQGIEMDHPDLAGNIIGNGFDTTNGSSPSLVRGSHGVPCAGIVGAIQNNIGISGVAPEAGLISVSNTLSFSTTTSQQLADGMNWSAQNGADIISNSWRWNPSAILDDAINNVLLNGRGGLGTIVVFATANSNNAVNYPANSNPDILAVGAMSPCGERKNPSSCDNESWGSCYGDELDVVAPGVLVYTTDRQGASGNASGDYHATFNGTSSACPHVAGVAALILSVEPSLSVKAVNDIIEASAYKTRSSDLYDYSVTPGRNNGLWNPETGYGLIDAHAAVLMAGGYYDQPNYDEEPSVSNFYIQNVVIDGKDMPTDYINSYFSSSSVPVYLRTSVQNLINVTNCQEGPQRFAVWVDFNRDNDFDDVNEKIGETSLNANGVWSSLNINLPNTVDLGVTQLRVMSVADGSTNLSPTGSYGAGQTVDYTVLMVDPNGYCLPDFLTNPESNYIAGIELNTIRHFGPGKDKDQVYSDYHDIRTNLIEGNSQELTIYSSIYDVPKPIRAEVEAWIDFNGNQIFEENEKIGTHYFTQSNASIIFEFNVPPNTPEGDKRLRIRTSVPESGSTGIIHAYPGPCDFNRCGEAEDYTVHIMPYEIRPNPCPGENCDHTMLIPDDIIIDNFLLDNGDILEACFYDDFGRIVPAGGTTYIEGAYNSFPMFSDCPDTPDKDGFENGDDIFFRSLSGGADYYPVTVEYYEVGDLNGIINNDSGRFGCNDISAIKGLRGTQRLSLNTGWNLISSYLDPSMSVVDLMEPIKEQVEIVKDHNGGVLYYFQNPNDLTAAAIPISTLGDFNIDRGYYIKMKSPAELTITGKKINVLETAVNLEEGWSYLPVYKNANLLVSDALSPIDEDVIIMKDENGAVWFPTWGINQIGDIEPGRSYKIKMPVRASFYYPNEYAAPPSNNSQRKAPSATSFQRAAVFKTVQKSNNSSTVIFPLDISMSLGLDIDDEILSYSITGELVGSARFDGTNVAINIWGDDVSTEEIEGLTEGEEMKFSVWKAASGYTAEITITDWLAGDGSYQSESIQIIGSVDALVLSNNSLVSDQFNCRILPNPTKGETLISIELEEKNELTIEIYDTFGKRIQLLEEGMLASGKHEYSWNASSLENGVYICTVTSGEFRFSKKIMVLK